ncbi:MAG: PaaI family thioesterase [Pseudomonadota bacterium]
MSAEWSIERLQAELNACPAIEFLGLQAEEFDQDQTRVVFRMPLRAELERAAGTKQFHGGPVASLIDTAGDYAVALAVGGGVPTVNFRVDYLRPSVGDYLLATAQARRVGRSLAVADIDVTDPEGRLCAIGRGCYSTAIG